ncbi:hypothetical protein KFK09_005725 [Dendrobium nobile]|uniref:Uncharacterized protein n=1 Tax=Dendrobium nobile TaxID=94219 RepID=A0A8T3BWG6_DENNO|nr:hypothetical protein KFK09_005725 [Dendrobium nobile]
MSEVPASRISGIWQGFDRESEQSVGKSKGFPGFLRSNEIKEIYSRSTLDIFVTICSEYLQVKIFLMITVECLGTFSFRYLYLTPFSLLTSFLCDYQYVYGQLLADTHINIINIS